MGRTGRARHVGKRYRDETAPTLRYGGAVAAIVSPLALLSVAAQARPSGTTVTGPRFSFTPYATVNPASGWTFVSGQFSGDSRTDVTGYKSSQGTVSVGTNVG